MKAILVLAMVATGFPAVADFDVQAALDAGAGGVVEVPPGMHVVHEPVRISGRGTVLTGYGTIVQANPDALVLLVEDAEDVRVTGVTFTRAEDVREAEAGGIRIISSRGVVLDGVRVRDCKAREAAITIADSQGCTVRSCEVRDYKRVAVDDRTDSPLYGYAFQCIDGTGILVDRCTQTTLEGNRITEEALLPTPEMKERHGLGRLVEGRQPTNPGGLGQTVARERYAGNWHQGSAIVVTGPEDTRHAIVRGNHIVNAAQGIDLHCDFAVVSGNVIDHAMIGLKATHGCRGLVLSDNLITHVDLWGVLLNPGAASHAGKEGRPPNVDAGIVVANNVIADFGYGHEYWNWGGRSEGAHGSYAIALFEGQLAENPPLRDVVISGNIVHDPGRDTGAPPRYRYAVYIGPWGEGATPGPNGPRDVLFSGNKFMPGVAAVSNTELNPEISP